MPSPVRLIFSEKPSVGRDIAEVLGATRKRQGYLEGNGFIVTWGIGHLVTLGQPEEQDPSWKKWDLDRLPMLPRDWKLSVLPDTRDQFEVVRELMARPEVTEVVNAADAGREGELIFRLVYRKAGCTKPVKRLWISSMTDEAIREGFATLRPGAEFDPLARAAECRQRADWLVGLNLTRAYTRKYGEMLTIGRVQTPTLAMVVKRHQEIAAFQPRDYWEIRVSYGDFSALWFDPREKETPTRLWDKAAAEALSQKLARAEAEVRKVSSACKKQPPPLLYDLTTLQREANTRFGYTAAQTLAAAQSLYERRKVITYPRTDSRHLSEDLHPTLSRRLAALPGEYAPFVQPLQGKTLPKQKRVFDNAKVSDHHAIIPTEQRPGDLNAWKPEERRIYDLVVRRFLAVFHPDHEYLSTTVLLQADGEHLKATGRVVLVPGWRALYDRHDKDETTAGGEEGEEGDDQALPALQQGDRRQPQGAELLTRQTKPPPPYTDATLLQAMETAGKLVENDELRLAMKESGLGTPATRAEIIEKLIRVGYLVREKKKLQPTPKGIQLIALVDAQIASPELTGAWEKRLADIAKAKAEAGPFMADIETLVTDVVERVRRERTVVRFAPAGAAARSSRVGAADAPASRQGRFPSNHGSRAAPPPTPKARPAGERTTAAASQAATGASAVAPSATGAAARSSAAPGAGVSPTGRPTFGICPACGRGNIIEGSRGFGCDRFREGCSYVVWKEFLGKKLSSTAIKALIAGRPTRVLKGFTREDGRVVSGKIRMRADGKGIELVEWGADQEVDPKEGKARSGSGGEQPA
ncbi:MAG: DNA topoisomerase III [Candidatus Ozemobacter sibiricus]|uniref:DNA topoisomerase n=1 Tax=Candidatus Ozemobacter sibiricus TaxID=2268124 RepID=A0A367ZVY4_9BACT|nr:MAG: DNA topoisomerase III [Candidatus Ozemobacter sibiricus]